MTTDTYVAATERQPHGSSASDNRLTCVRLSTISRRLAGFGLVVAAGNEPLRLRSEHIDKPFTIDVLHVVISKASEQKLLQCGTEQRRFNFQ